ncbi:MAG: RadC family protein [Thiogranum sp.]
MSIQHWPEAERPREKLLSAGPGSLSDAELLAIFLRSGTRGQSAVELARTLIKDYGGLRPLMLADKNRLCAAKGLGPAKYAQLQAVLELSRRHLGEGLRRGKSIKNPDDTKRYIVALLRDHTQEVFACLFLDCRHRLISYKEMFWGTIDGATVHPREVVRRALEHNAAAVILAHNHPSGVAEPSGADRRITQRLKEALGLVDVRVLDHVVVGDQETVSFAERGWL